MLQIIPSIKNKICIFIYSNPLIAWKSYSCYVTHSLQNKLSFSQADNGRGGWTQLLESVWATRLQSSIVIYCKHTLILREICHNTESARCVPPVVEAFPRPLGHPVKHRDIYSLSYLGSHRLTLQRGREWKDLGWKSQSWTCRSCSFGLGICVCELMNECVVPKCREEIRKTTTQQIRGCILKVAYLTIKNKWSLLFLGSPLLKESPSSLKK